jgi:hypothetical protein
MTKKHRTMVREYDNESVRRNIFDPAFVIRRKVFHFCVLKQ